MKANDQKEVAIKEKGGAVANVNIEQFADQGFDNVDSKSLALPFLKVLGQLSPQVTQGDSQFIPEARPGMIFNTVTNQLYDGTKGVTVIPCFYKLEYIEWKDRGMEGSSAPVNIYPADSDIMSKTTRDDKNKDRLPNGNYVEETASHYVTVLDDKNVASTALITMKSTQRKKSKKWNSMMMSVRAKRKDGSFFKPGTFTQMYNLKTVLEKNNLGSWYGWEIEHIGTVNSGDVLQGAFEFHKTCKEGSVKVNHDKEDTVEKTPF